jgi:hypothetical protein
VIGKLRGPEFGWFVARLRSRFRPRRAGLTVSIWINGFVEPRLQIELTWDSAWAS